MTHRKELDVPPKYTPEQRILVFWSKVDRSGGEDACWNWIGSKEKAGYGSLGWERRTSKAHRIAYMLVYGELPSDLDVLHHCDNRACCNPAHLFLGTQFDNVRDMMRKGRDRKARGEQNGNCKVTDAQVAEIRHRYAVGDVTYKQLAHEFCVSTNGIGDIVRRKTRA